MPDWITDGDTSRGIGAEEIEEEKEKWERREIASCVIVGDGKNANESGNEI